MSTPLVNLGLDLMNLNETPKEEIDAHLAAMWSWRGPLYELSAQSLMLDFAPDFAKLHRWASTLYGRPEPSNVVMLSSQNIHTYVMVGWETGILNEFHTLRRWGMSKAQLMEMVMFTQLVAGMRGLGHVYRAVGDLLPVWADPPEPPPFPEGWAVDAAAFKSGLDLTTRSFTAEDKKNLEGWYEQTLGYVPNSIVFGIKHHPEFVKVHRAKWEVAIKTLPKQIVPYLMLRHHIITGNRQGLREAAILGKAWGISNKWLIQGITGSAYYCTSFDGLYTAYDAVEDLL